MPVYRVNPTRPKKALGQNFLKDDNVARKIIAAIQPSPDDAILEVGPGPGALTKYLAVATRMLTVVEIDDRIARDLNARYGPKGVMVLHEDFLTTDLGRIARDYERPLRIVGNIPYNITSPILFHVLDHRSVVRHATFMMQKEVAVRLVAHPGTKDYGILSVFCQLFSDVRKLFDVSPNAFSPRPSVMSSIVQLAMLPRPRFALADEEFFRGVVRSVFGKRRKTLRNSLQYFLEFQTPPLEIGGIDLQKRPEALSIEELVAMSNALFETESSARTRKR